MKSIIQFIFVCSTCGYLTNNEKDQFCANLECVEEKPKKVCGIKEDGEGFSLKIFDSSCDLLYFGCGVPDNEAYGVINMEYCDQAFSGENVVSSETANMSVVNQSCSDYPCPETQDLNYTCAWRQDGNGYRIRLFKNNCQLQKYNCQNNANFIITDDYLCDGVEVLESDEIDIPANPIDDVQNDGNVQKNLFIVDGRFLNYNGNITDTVENFFAATHVLDLPVREIPGRNMSENTRRMVLSKFGPQKVFTPWITIPKNRSDDHFHKPTLSSCYHKCPSKCPDTYAPVCGVPGNMAREPSLMFQNHCFMDVAQCKMFWEDKSSTAESSAYIESSFMFCLGEEMNGMFRFLPLVRTLQHMGRLKKKGRFRYKFYNMRFFNNLLSREPKLMG